MEVPIEKSEDDMTTALDSNRLMSKDGTDPSQSETEQKSLSQEGSQSPTNKNTTEEKRQQPEPAKMMQKSADVNSSDDKKKELTESKAPAIKEKLLADSKGPEQPVNEVKEKETRFQTVELDVPVQYIDAVFTSNLSSNTLKKDQIIFIQSASEIKVGAYTVARNGARVKTLVKDSKASYDGSRGLLSLEFIAVETEDGQWLNIQYPVYSNKKKGEVIFKKGTKIPKLKTERSQIKFQIPIQ